MAKNEKGQADDSIPDEPEDWARENIRELRVEHGWNQSELARRMQQVGFEHYNQMLVSRTEKGERPIRVNELRGFAQVFGVEMQDILDPGPWAGIASHFNRLAAAKKELAEAVERYLALQEGFAIRLTALTVGPDPRVSGEAVDLGLQLLSDTPYEVVAMAWNDFQETEDIRAVPVGSKDRDALEQLKMIEEAQKQYAPDKPEVTLSFHQFWKNIMAQHDVPLMNVDKILKDMNEGNHGEH